MVMVDKIDGIKINEIYKNLSLKDMTGERWKDIEGYEGLYMVSDLGRVKSVGNDKNRKDKILKQCKDTNGYLLVYLCKDGKAKGFLVHRLVAKAFIKNPLNLPCINHINELKQVNIASVLYGFNLEWCDHKYNNNYGTHNKRISESMLGVHINGKLSKKVLCVETNTVYPSTMEAGRQTGIGQGHISQCCNGIRKSAGGYHWQYVD